MHLKIEHRTHYQYESPQKFVVQSYRLTPSLCANQKTLSWAVEVEGARFGARFTDGAGDQILTMTLAGPVDSVDIRIIGEVITQDMAGVLRDHKESMSPRIYLRSTPITTPDRKLKAVARELSQVAQPRSLDLAHAMSYAVGQAIQYTPGATHPKASAREALALGAGVCQDHAHVLITLARLNGFPARYVTGYLYTDADGNRHEASHAWAEIFVEGLGWVGFDSTNACCVDERYVRLGSGLDAHEAAPIRGVAYGDGVENMLVSVAVAENDKEADDGEHAAQTNQQQ